MARYLITGCSSGIGEALAREAVRRGHTVVGAARRLDRLEVLARELGTAFTPLALDVSDKASVQATLKDLEPLPDVVIMNAGYGVIDSARGFELEVHERAFGVNYFGAMYVVDALFPRFLARKSGAFVATSSLAGYRGMPDSAAYSASKSALTTAFEAMRITYSKWSGIRFQVIHPGFVETDMTAKNPYPMPFMWKADKAARFILDGIAKGRFHINFPLPTWLACVFARLLPPVLLYQLLARRHAPKDGKRN